jgi:hypothetical protein
MRSSNYNAILFVFVILIVCSFTPIANSETVTEECDASQCFNTQFTLYDVEGNKSNFMYEINDEWYDNYTALELMMNVFSTQNMTYATSQYESSIFIEDVNGTAMYDDQGNSFWEWAVYIDEDGMWVSTDMTVEQIIIKNIDNYAVCLIPSAEGSGHNPFSQSVEDWLAENSVDEYFHSSGKVNSDGELEGIQKDGNSYHPWVVRTTGELLGTDLSEIEMRVEGGDSTDGEEVLTSMILSNGTDNVTGWWEMTWNDVDEDGDFSVGDNWMIRTDEMDTHGLDWYATFVRMDSKNSSTPGFGILLTLSAVSIIALARKSSRD